MLDHEQPIRGITVLICANYAWTVFNFRLPIIRKLKAEGVRIVVVTQFDGYEDKFRDEVDEVVNLRISRQGINPLVDLITIMQLWRTLRSRSPNVVLLFTVKPVVYGSLIARFCGIPAIPMITGLGTVFIQTSLLTEFVTRLYRFAVRAAPIIFFQNKDDYEVFRRAGILSTQDSRFTPGSGIDLDHFQYRPELQNSGRIKFLLLARMLWDKGVGEFVSAARVLKAEYSNVDFQLLGPLGVQNRSSISHEQMVEWQTEGVIEYLGETDDVRGAIIEASCIVLPSYREGTPRALLEAAAIGRSIVTTDVPGCREVVEHGVSGLLCEARNVPALVGALEKIINMSQEARDSMGAQGRRMVEQRFSDRIVCDLYLDAISEVASEVQRGAV